MQCLILEPDVCQSIITATQQTGQEYWKKFVFDKEKVISSLTINLETATNGTAAFVIAYSRTCSFDSNAQIIQHNGSSKVGAQNASRLYTYMCCYAYLKSSALHSMA